MSLLDIHDPDATLAGVIERVRRGEHITISEEGKPVARIIALLSDDKAPISHGKDSATIPAWKASIMQAAGMWKDRDDIPGLMADIRQEGNRIGWQSSSQMI